MSPRGRRLFEWVEVSASGLLLVTTLYGKWEQDDFDWWQAIVEMSVLPEHR